MSEVAGYYLIECRSNTIRDKLIYFLSEDTRPDFEDEVPEADRPLFALIDGFPEPEDIEPLDDHSLWVEFEYDADEAQEGFLEIFDIIKPKVCIFASFGDAIAFERYNPNRIGGFEMMYCSELEGEVDSALEPAWLNDAQILELNKITDESFQEGMIYLASFS